ncbi:MAG TPA: AAA family ATPase [Chitinophagaceae bacterium]|nr:AAA family ATPase [Chitinophagaceae bacterium]
MLPLFKKPFDIQFDTPVIIIAGDNGSGKSTLLEAIAHKLGLPTIGSYSTITDNTFAGARALYEHIHFNWKNKTHNGMFFRAEDYVGFVRSIETLKGELGKDIEEMKEYLRGQGLQLAQGALRGQINELESRYNGKLEEKSHGEGFLQILTTRIHGNGVYVLDEPEASLSPMKQLALVSLLMQSAKETDAQFIIATHSPVIMGMPNSTIYYLGDNGPEVLAYEDTEHYHVYKSFLENRERFLRYL